MNRTKFLKIITSLPVILMLLYFMPFLGVIYLFFRPLVNNNRKYKLSFILIIIGVIIYIPKVIDNLVNTDIKIVPFLNMIVNNNLYNMNVLKYANFLLIIGFIYLSIELIIEILLINFKSFIKNYIKNHENKQAQISAENDLIMKEKREKAKNSHVIYCPYCGADNLLTAKVGVCKYCRRNLTSKD